MGIFDIFSAGPAQDAANAQTQGLQNALGIYGFNNQQARDVLTGQAGNALGALGTNYGAGLGSLGTGYGNALSNLTGNYAAGLGALAGYGGNAIDALNQNYAAGLAPNLQNYATASGGVNQLGNALGLNGPAGNAAATAGFWNNPAIQSQLDIGSQNVLRNAAATGTLASGGTLADLQKFGQQTASQGWNNYVNQLQPYLNFAQGAAGNIGNLSAGLGSNLANTYGMLGQSSLGAYTGLGNALANTNVGLGNAANANLMNLGNLSAGVYGGLGTGLANLYGQMGQAGYGTNVGMGNAAANADLANYNASGNLWGLGLGLLGAGTGAAGQAGGFGGLGSNLFNLASNGFRPGMYAEGGRPPVNQPSIVGERGPELFVPDRPGMIMPNNYGDGLMRTAGDVLSPPWAIARPGMVGRPTPGEVGAGVEQRLPRIVPGNERLPNTINPNMPGVYPRGRYGYSEQLRRLAA